MNFIKQKTTTFAFFVMTLFSALFLMVSCHKTKPIRLNEIQVIGSHNSYKIPIEQPLWEYLYQIDSARALSLQYGHISILEQLDLGLRNLELDVLHDPSGGKFIHPKGLEIVKSLGKKPLPYDDEKELHQAGLKMFHIQDIDFRSHHLLFKEGLKTIKKWSDEHPNHTPIFILINAKDSHQKNLSKLLPFTKAALDSIDLEIRSVFKDSQLITPDLVRGNYKTLEEAILTDGWPDLNTVKGRFLFVLDEKEEKNNRYIKGHPSLKNRVMFVNSKEGNPEAAFRVINNPIKEIKYIKELVSRGYMVRTRADDGTNESRTNDYCKFEMAKKSGAQVISTDYYVQTTLYKSTYKVNFKNSKYERIKK
ncbi:phosphatidylinositol-specific phospholipase C1-like protein [Wenyingzhuangia sp. IMCC45467]